MEPRTTLPEAVAVAFADQDPFAGGAVVRLSGDLRDTQDDPRRPRWRTSAPVHLAAAAVTRIARALSEHGPAEAGEVFIEEFGDAYGFAADVGDVQRLMVWPEGTAEPD
jgi:hypothetical protein